MCVGCAAVQALGYTDKRAKTSVVIINTAVRVTSAQHKVFSGSLRRPGVDGLSSPRCRRFARQRGGVLPAAGHQRQPADRRQPGHHPLPAAPGDPREGRAPQAAGLGVARHHLRRLQVRECFIFHINLTVMKHSFCSIVEIVRFIFETLLLFFCC